MADTVHFEEVSIRIRSGDLVLSKVRITGWQEAAASARDFTDNNRLWGRITAGNVLQLYSDAAMTTLVAHSGVIAAAGVVTIDEDNSSGLDGDLHVSYTLGTEQLFDIVLTYADELDLKRLYQGLIGELDSGSQYEGQGMRFEALLASVKREKLDPLIWEKYGPRGSDEIEADDQGRPMTANIGDPRQLAPTHALFAIAAIYLRRASEYPEYVTLAMQMEKAAKIMFDSTALAFDADADAEADETPELPDYTLDRA